MWKVLEEKERHREVEVEVVYLTWRLEDHSALSLINLKILEIFVNMTQPEGSM